MRKKRLRKRRKLQIIAVVAYEELRKQIIDGEKVQGNLFWVQPEPKKKILKISNLILPLRRGKRQQSRTEHKKARKNENDRNFGSYFNKNKDDRNIFFKNVQLVASTFDRK